MLWITPLLLAALAVGPQTPSPENEVVVYFDRGSATLNGQGPDILYSNVWRMQTSGGVITVEGHTSTVGSAAANVSLAQRRATVVQADLVARGVPGHRLRTVALGETAPARPTADEVDEPLNDRVVVRFLR